MQPSRTEGKRSDLRHADRAWTGRDERSSAWIRLAQAWGGPGFGALFVPRIGQEVLVRFFDGNPDRPVVTGALFNGTSTVPIHLPDDRTRSTLRTDSSPGGGGWNEIRFEDLKSAEQLHTHAQKDEQIEVRRDKRQRVKANEELQVDEDRSQRVNGAQTLRVKGDDQSIIEGKKSAVVAGDRSVRVRGSHEEEIGGDHVAQVGRNRSVVVYQASEETIAAASTLGLGTTYSVQVARELSEDITAEKTVTVGGKRWEEVRETRVEQVGGDSRSQIGGAFRIDVAREASSSVAQDLSEEVSGGTRMQAKDALEWTARGVKLQADKLRQRPRLRARRQGRHLQGDVPEARSDLVEQGVTRRVDSRP